MIEYKYYIVKAKCGHVGRDKYMPIKFPIMAKNKKQAADIVRHKPRVKKDHKDAILDVNEVDKKTFDNQVFCNNYDPYLNVKSKYEQNKVMSLICFRLQEDNHSKKKVVKTKRSNVGYKLLKQAIEIAQKKIEINNYLERNYVW